MCYNFLEINAKYFYTLINIRDRNGRLMSRNKSEIDIFFILDETVNIFTIRKYFYVASYPVFFFAHSRKKWILHSRPTLKKNYC